MGEHQINAHSYYGIHGVNNDKATKKEKNHGVFVCDYDGCKQTFSELKRLTEHKRYHNKSIECSQCKKKFARKWDLNIHIKTKHKVNAQSFEQCKYCKKEFATVSALRKHVKLLHSGCDKRFLCRICHKSFNRESSLQNHYKSHVQKKKAFDCKLCRSSFAYKYNLNKHVRKYH